MTTILNAEPSMLDEYLRQLRDVELQTDRTRFEQNLEMLGMFAGYELSKMLHYEDHATVTPLGTANTPVLTDKIVLNTVLRAGLPVLQGVHKVLQNAELSFIGAARREDGGEGIKIDLGYVAGPDLSGKTLVMADTMLATGHSLVESYNLLTTDHGTPDKVYIIAVIASQPGIEYVEGNIPGAELVVCAVDPQLNDKFYIVPGLGDAGDLLYGEKL